MESIHGPVYTRKMTPEEYEKYFGKPPEVIRDRNGVPIKKPVVIRTMQKNKRGEDGFGSNGK